MAESYPRRDQARGLWKINDITKNIKDEGTYPQASSQSSVLFAGGQTPSNSDVIDEINILSAGNATDFGNLSTTCYQNAGCGSVIRGVILHGLNPSASNTMDYVHYASKGNAADFGNAVVSANARRGMSNNVRGIWAGGDNPQQDTIDFFTIASLGNATDFGNRTTNSAKCGAGANSTRGLMAGGHAPSNVNIIDFIQLNTTGNAVDFGDLSAVTDSTCAVTSPTICVWTRVGTATPEVDTEFSQFGSLGNSIDFGDLATGLGFGEGGTGSNSVKGIVGGGDTPSLTNVIQSCVIATRGNFTDFGDLTVAREELAGCSNGHGGIDLFEPRAPELYSPTGKPLVFGGVGVGDIALFNNGSALEFINISTLGNAVSFGTSGVGSGGAAASNTRAVYHHGETGNSNISYVEFSTKGNGADFGDTTVNRGNLGGTSNATRGMFFGGEAPSPSDVIDYITIATLGNATDFGNLTVARGNISALCNTTRAVAFGGYAAPAYSDVMDYVTIASTSNATDFGNLVEASSLGADGAGGSSQTRGIIAGGGAGPSYYNKIQYITIASTSNTTDFGDLTSNRQSFGAAGNGTRGIYAGGAIVPANTAAIDYITIASTANSQDFGDLTSAGQGQNGASNCHGALA